MRETFERDGIVRVVGAVAADDVRAMRACARERIAAVPFVEIAGAMRPARGTELDLWEIGRDPAFAPLPAALSRALDQVFGAGVWAQVEGELGGLAMPTLPCPGATSTACDVAWHVDEPTPADGTPGRSIIAYAFLDVVEPGGGATVVSPGSHRRLASIAGRLGTSIQHGDALGALAREDSGFAGGAVELTGEPGDIVLLDPRCMHTISANVSTRARLVMRLTCVTTPASDCSRAS